MKHANIFLSVGLASILAVAACTKEQQIAETPLVPEKGTMTISATLPTLEADATKVDFSQGSAAVELAWSDNDALTIIDESTNTSSTFTLVSKDGSKAVFKGPEITGDSFTVLYPGTVTSVDDMAAKTFTGQTQDGNADLKHLSGAFTACLTGVTDLEDIKFEAPSGGTFSQSGIIKFYLQMPDYVTDLTEVTIETDSDLFYADNDATMASALSLSLSGITFDTANAFTAYLATSQKASTIPSGKTVSVKVSDADGIVWKRDITLTADLVITPGKVSVIKLNGKGWDTESRYAGGTGVDGDPYLIATPTHLVHMSEDLKDNTTLYFKMIADVDLQGINWVAPNNSGSFAKAIDFDGDSHTISHLTVSSGDYPSFIGVLNGAIKNVVFDEAEITAGNNTAGVVAGYVGSSNASVSGAISGITVKNSNVLSGTKNRLGGIAGYINVVTEDVTDCHVINTTVSCTQERIGGLFGQTDKNINISDCSAENVTVSGKINIGGIAGVGYSNFTDCTSSGNISSINTTSNTDIALGGLVGYFENGKISHCSSYVVINQTTNGRDLGGLVGKMLVGTVEKSFATGNVTGQQRNAAGLVGLVSLNSGKAIIKDSYCTGDVNANAYMGGLIGLHEKGIVEVTNCYASGNVIAAGFAAGGLVGVIGSADFTMSGCAAWGGEVTPGSYGDSNWSSGAVAGVASPKCTLTDNYRNPAMALTAWWVPAADYQHADVSASHPLTDKDGNEMTDASTSSGQPNYPHYGYHGKVDATKTLSELASTTLGWDSSIWDFSGALPTLK